MSVQTIIVGLIVLAAMLYVGVNVRRKMKSFSGKSSCGSDNCGCGTNSAAKKSPVRLENN